MVICQQSSLIEVRRLDNRGRGGRGVFATCDIAEGTVVEQVPVILIPKNQVFGDTETSRHNRHISWYVFDWDGITKREYVALALGYGSIYNHSYAPNAKYVKVAPDVIEFHAIKPIAAGEEIFINYNGEADPERPVEFSVHSGG